MIGFLCRPAFFFFLIFFSPSPSPFVVFFLSSRFSGGETPVTTRTSRSDSRSFLVLVSRGRRLIRPGDGRDRRNQAEDCTPFRVTVPSPLNPVAETFKGTSRLQIPALRAFRAVTAAYSSFPWFLFKPAPAQRSKRYKTFLRLQEELCSLVFRPCPSFPATRRPL